MNVMFAAFLFMGHMIFTMGLYTEDANTMIMGRFIYGLGGESIAITITTILSVWFLGKDIGLA